MQRREFIDSPGLAAVSWPCISRAQSPNKVPVVGFLNGASPDLYTKFLGEFRRGLSEMGFVEGKNVIVEYRWAENHFDRLPELAADLVRRQVSVIAATSTPAALAAKSANRQSQLCSPAIFVGREFAAAGGLISYGGSVADSYHLAGIYTGRILTGEKPRDLPVHRSSKVEMYINLRTANTLGIAIPPGLVIAADEVFE